MIALDVEVEAEGWRAVDDPAGLCRRAAEAALAVATEPNDPPDDVSVAILLADDAAVRELNRLWRGRDRPTNVLSFPAEFVRTPPGVPQPLGDVVLALETVEAEAALEGKLLGHHLAHLVVHGILHLFGYDHGDEEDADRMESAERRALARLGIPDPYRAVDPAGAVAAA